MTFQIDFGVYLILWQTKSKQVGNQEKIEGSGFCGTLNKPHDLLSSKVQSIGKVQLDFQNPKFSFEGTHYLGWVLDCRENTNETVQNVFLVNLTGRKKCKKVWLYLL